MQNARSMRSMLRSSSPLSRSRLPATAVSHSCKACLTSWNSMQCSATISRGFSSFDRPRAVLQKQGNFPYGSREYLLVLKYPHEEEANGDKAPSEATRIASLRAHRNIIFGARLFGTTAEKHKISRVCLPLLDAALEDASIEGEQPQAMATLHGLCNWVAQCIENENTGKGNDNDSHRSEALQKLKTDSDDDLVSYHAVHAIATGIPRQGHSIVGQGTFRDGEQGWEELAKEFIKLKLADEVELYQSRGGTVVTIEHLADTNPDYLRSAGGAMARLFFM